MTDPHASTGPFERKTTCNRDCPDTCGIVATVKDERVIALRGDPQHPVTRGALCYRTQHFLRTQYSSERLTTPLIRKHGELTAATWDEALDFVATELTAIRATWGPAAIVHYRSGGSLGLLKLLTDYFFSLFGPVTIKRGDICAGAGEAAQRADFGVSDSSDLFTLLESRHIVLWGKNLVTSSPHTLRVVHEARKRGARVLLIDPVHHATVKHCDQYIQLRPGGDFALAMAVAHACFERGFIAPDAAMYCDQLEDFRALVQRQSRAAWCQLADVTEAEALAVAHALHAGPSAIVVGWGLGRRSDGGAIVRALDALGAITGNVGIAGGGVSFYFRRTAAFDTAFTQPNPPPRTVCEPQLARDLVELRDPPVRALWVTCGNPVAMLPDSDATAAAIRGLPLSIVVDAFLTDTARVASVVLPTTTLLEADDLLGAYGHHFVSVSRPVVAAPSGNKSDLEIIQALAERVGLGPALAGSARSWKARFLAGSDVELANLERSAVRNPAAPSVVFADRKFPTDSGKVNLITEAPPPSAAPPADYPLRLLALSTRDSQSSQWVDKAPERLELTVHPSAARGLADNTLCSLESRHGRIHVQLRHDPNQRADIALLPKGGSYAARACANSLIAARLTDIGEGGALYEECVRIVPEP